MSWRQGFARVIYWPFYQGLLFRKFKPQICNEISTIAVRLLLLQKPNYC